MPVSMSGSPKPKSPHWLEHETLGHGCHDVSCVCPLRLGKKKAEAEFQARQKEWSEKQAIEAAYEKEQRKEMQRRLEARLEHAPGYGPSRWLWPTAAKHPRVWASCMDTLIEPGSGPTSAGPGAALGSPIKSSRPSSPTAGMESPM